MLKYTFHCGHYLDYFSDDNHTKLNEINSESSQSPMTVVVINPDPTTAIFLSQYDF